MSKLFCKLTIIITTIVVSSMNFGTLASQASIKNKKENKVRFIAHRGLSSQAPENTLPSYILACRNNFYGCECDLQETKDKRFIIMHDDTLDRMTNGSGKVSDFTLEELKKLNIDEGSNIEKYKEIKIPTLEEYLHLCTEEKIKPVIELKNLSKTSLKKFLNIINRFKLNDNVIIISFNNQILQYIRNRDSNIDLQWIADLNKENIDFCSENNINIDCYKETVNLENIKYAHDKGILVNIWTVDEEDIIQKCISFAADYITTNKIFNY